MTRQNPNHQFFDALNVLAEHGFEGMAQAIQILLNEAMKIERQEFLRAAPYERTPDRRGSGNGFKDKRVKSRLGELELRIPQVRDVKDSASFYPNALERGERAERALKLALAEMYVNGVSTRKVAGVTRELCGIDISSAQVSRAAKALDEELEKWRSRPLGANEYLVLDARYEKIRHGGQVVSAAVLTAIGIRKGIRSVIGVSVGLSEAEVHWREFLSSLKTRGLCGVTMITSDGHEGLKAALKAAFPGVPWQRCQVHLQRNAQGYVPRVGMRKAVARDLRDVFNAPNLKEAERLLDQCVTKYKKKAPRLSEWMEKNVPEGFTVYGIPAAHRRRLRSTNLLEWLNKEILRRTRVATLFPNEESLLRLVSAVLVEISEDWETDKRYLPKVEED